MAFVDSDRSKYGARKELSYCHHRSSLFALKRLARLQRLVLDAEHNHLVVSKKVVHKTDSPVWQAIVGCILSSLRDNSSIVPTHYGT